MKCRAYKRSSFIKHLRAKLRNKMAPGPKAGYYEETEREPLLGVPNPAAKTDVEKGSNKGQTKSVPGPDGLLSWGVAIANFLINFIVVGLGRMSGILYVVFMQLFNADRQTASIPFSVQQAARNLFGPLAGILGQKYGIRSVVIVGGFVGTISAGVCFFATDLNWITVMWGLMFGICTALTTTLNQISIDQYFEKYRTSAGGLAFSGGCVGAFIFPVVLELLIERYGLGGTFLVMAAMILNVVPCALVLVDPPWKKQPTQQTSEALLDKSSTARIENEKTSYNTFSSTPKHDNRVEKYIDFEYLRQKSEFVYQLFSVTVAPEEFLQDTLLETEWSAFDALPIVEELEDLYSYLNPSLIIKKPTEMATLVDELTRSVHVIEVTCPTDNNSALTASMNANDRESKCNSEMFDNYEDNPRWLFLAIKLSELCERSNIDIYTFFPTSSHTTVAKVMELLNDFNHLIIKHEENSTLIKTEKVKQENISNKEADKPPFRKTDKRKHRNSNSLVVHIQTAIQLHGNPLFLLICLCRGVFMLTFIPMVTIIVDLAVDKGLKQDTGKYVIACLSLGDLLGRLCLGWVTDSGLLSLPRYMLVVMLLLGASTATLPLMHSEVSLMPAVLVFGMLQGSLFIRHQILVSNYMRPHEQAIGMGFINLLSGFLGFTLPFYIGYFRDTLGSYDKMFYVNGGICAGIGLLWMFEPCIVRWSQNSKLNEYKHFTETIKD
ncbi:hypothetical protein JTE90_025447 [Oedothorax gibbosus]|uniref:Monocarboxylate transporter 9 n=1 Tax=Oedothorax gibbosus TaxID=931172 RepID=A0AAV6U7U1_9ARAC|nr:hypothetical protein JTE90_025447 [Oedothorax gibbosus]